MAEPPSTTSVWPVTKAASSLARKLTAPTRSSGVSSRGMARVGAAEVSPCLEVQRVLQHAFGEGEARGERVDGDAVLADFAREGARHRDHRAFARDVVQEEGHALQGRAGGEVDDAAAARRAHVRHARAAAQEDAQRVHVHHLAPFGGVDLLERPDVTVLKNAALLTRMSMRPKAFTVSAAMRATSLLDGDVDLHAERASRRSPWRSRRPRRSQFRRSATTTPRRRARGAWRAPCRCRCRRR